MNRFIKYLLIYSILFVIFPYVAMNFTTNYYAQHYPFVGVNASKIPENLTTLGLSIFNTYTENNENLQIVTQTIEYTIIEMGFGFFAFFFFLLLLDYRNDHTIKLLAYIIVIYLSQYLTFISFWNKHPNGISLFEVDALATLYVFFILFVVIFIDRLKNKKIEYLGVLSGIVILISEGSFGAIMLSVFLLDLTKYTHRIGLEMFITFGAIAIGLGLLRKVKRNKVKHKLQLYQL